MQSIRDLSGPIGFFENFPEILLLSIAVMVILLSLHQPRFIIANLGAMALRRSGLIQHPTRPTFRHIRHHFPNAIDRHPATSRAQKFGFAASLKIALSSVRSATTFFRRLFSRSKSFNRRA